jgi:hypothetical protein
MSGVFYFPYFTNEVLECQQVMLLMQTTLPEHFDPELK